MSDDIAISVQGVSKDFHYSSNRANSVKGILTGIFKEEENQKDIQHALKDVSFDVKKGEFFGIVGRNGSGKSTLLKIIAGIYQPNKGSVRVNGKLVPFIELGVGFNPELTGKENVYLNGALLGFSKKEISAMYNEIVEFAELEKFMNQKLKNYSSGMQVRLAFSMAVRAKADILLIDEVLAVGDADFQRKCFDYFKKLKRDKKTVIFVSHDMTAVREYCDRAILINKSKLVKSGDADSISQKYTELFMAEQPTVASSTDANRWGEGQIKTTKVQCEFVGNSIVIKQRVKALQDNLDPILGIRIRDGGGNEVTGTNTQIENTKLPLLARGDSLTIEWTVPNVFSDGKYVIDTANLVDAGTTVADWWDDALTIRIVKSRHLPYVVDPGFSVEVTKK